MLKRTPFYEYHKSLGAKIVDFAGYEMPILYSGIIEEHLSVRNSVGVFDVSHMGEFIIHGNNTHEFLQQMTINDVAKIKPGRAQYSAMCYEDGGLVDDLLIYKMENKYMMVVNAANITKDYDWLLLHHFGNVEIENVSDKTALLAVQGPRSLQVIQKLFNEDLSKLVYYSFIESKYEDIPVLISRTGYTGELGYELYFNATSENAKKIWEGIFEAGKEFNIVPIGLGARDTLRLEMGYCLYGNDIDKATNPLEAGLSWITALGKNNFIGKEKIIEEKEKGIKRRMVGFILQDKNIARHGYKIMKENKEIGEVTSGAFSPSLQRGIGMGYVAVENAKEGENISVIIRGKEASATIVSMPFLKKH